MEPIVVAQSDPSVTDMPEAVDGSNAAKAPNTTKDLDEFRPKPVFTRGKDWIRLTSGEWLRGELSSLSRDRIEFDSEELDELQIEWEDVAEVVTDQPFTLLLLDRTTIVGVPRIDGDSIKLTTPDGARELTRADVMGFIHGRPTRRNYWSGHVRAGGTISTGNVEQLDTHLSLSAVRRSAKDRFSGDFDSIFSEVEGVEISNKQTFSGSMDFYLTPRLYARPLGINLLHDEIQNIELQIAPYAGFGYMLIDDPEVEWQVTGGLGYRGTEYRSVAAGEDSSDETSTGIFTSDYKWEVSGTVDLSVSYGFQASLEDVEDTNHDASFGLTFELPWDLDFDFRAIWRRVGQPEPDENNETPGGDDLRLQIGVVWEF